MVAALKQVCQQLARNPSQCTRPRSIRQSFANTTHRHASQCRAYTTTQRASAAAQPDEIAEDDLDGYLEALDEDLPKESELPSLAHAELEQHRELRAMVRIAAWEMPLLARFAKKYQASQIGASPLRWRYTTYFSEQHPAGRKVVCEFKVKALADKAFGGKVETRERQMMKLKKLCGSRYNPESGWVRMSCESFATQAQNKRYLADTISRLIAEAKDLESGDNFEDIPLDVRHHKKKVTHPFPKEWRLDTEKRAELEEKRRLAVLEEGKRVEEKRIVSGEACIEADRQLRLSQAEQPVMAQVRQGLPRGNMGQRGRN